MCRVGRDEGIKGISGVLRMKGFVAFALRIVAFSGNSNQSALALGMIGSIILTKCGMEI